MTKKTKWVHPVIRKVRANRADYRKAHPELSELSDDELAEKMMESVFGLRRRT